jgi:hypothetical protein
MSRRICRALISLPCVSNDAVEAKLKNPHFRKYPSETKKAGLLTSASFFCTLGKSRSLS